MSNTYSSNFPKNTQFKKDGGLDNSNTKLLADESQDNISQGGGRPGSSHGFLPAITKKTGIFSATNK
jgi:hypothetical protein